MNNRNLARRVIFLLAASAFCVIGPVAFAAEDVVSGVVKNTKGVPEAGVWVIAETDDLPTPYRKIVVTDDTGRFVLPELPDAGYRVWVRGYGLLDSEAVTAKPGAELALAVRVAADSLDAAQVYPASHWFSLFAPPAPDTIGTSASTSAGGLFTQDGAAAAKDPFANQGEWMAQYKLNCVLCHQVGAAPTRLPEANAFDHGFLKSVGMNYFADTLGRARLLGAMDAWGKRLANGAVPPAPARPTGVERNVVITQWAWGDGYTYAHDEIATDKRDPTVNAGGPIYGVDLANDHLLTLDPRNHKADRIKVPTLGGFRTPWAEQTWKSLGGKEETPFGFGSLGSPWPGSESAHKDAYQNPANPHNPMMDAKGRVWLTTQIRRQWAEDAPAFCRDEPVIAGNRHHRQLGYYDPATGIWQLIDTCYGTHHLQFDAKGVLWTSGDDFVVGGFDPARFDPAKPESLARANRHSEVRLDTDGDGKADQSLVGFHYGVIPNPRDGSVWSAVPPGISSPPGKPGWLLRYDPVQNRHEAYSPPAPGMGPRGVDVDTRGVVWTALAGSGQLASFDRSRCRQHWGLGQQCPEGWTLYPVPGPRVAGMDPEDPRASADMFYYLWVDQFDTLGLGKDTVILNGTNSDALIAFVPGREAFVTVRIPYPLNTYTRGLDGRIDDPSAGWKGRAVWFTNGLDPILHSEVPQSYVGKVQLRPNPLAH